MSKDTGEIVIKVERKHILHAQCGDAEACAIAEAIKEQYPEQARAGVSVGAHIQIGDKYWRMPAKAERFIEHFDNLDQDDNTGLNKPDRHTRPTTIKLKCSQAKDTPPDEL